MPETQVLINDGSRRLNCLIEGESVVFPATVGRDCVVSDLKEEIRRERALDSLKDVDPHTMELWRVNIDLETHSNHSLSHLEPESLQGVEELTSWKSVGQYWSNQPPTTYLHIIVKVPAAAAAQKWRRIIPLAPSERTELDIEAIDRQINRVLPSLREAVRTFLNNPEPSEWVPPAYVEPGDREFLTNLRIPCYRNGYPSLLFHDLDKCDDAEIKEIFESDQPVCICNTSGSGKTRRMLEGLTKYWGFYLVAVPDANDVGVRDLQDALADVTEYQDWMTDLRGLPPFKRAAQNKSNSLIISKHLRKVLAARTVVFKLFLELAISIDGELQEKHKRIWLLFQLSDRLFLYDEYPHPFVRVINECLRQASSVALDILVERLDDIRHKYLPRTQFIFGLDEAQRAARLYPFSFISSTSTEVFRSVIREIFTVFAKSPIKIVLSGTRLSLADLRDVMASGVSKPDGVQLFHQLGMFDTWPKLEPYLKRYIPASILKTRSGYYLQQRIREYLLGRYRFSASFLEFFLINGLESPHKLLNEYIQGHTGCLPGDAGDPYTSQEPEFHIEVDMMGFEWDKLESDPVALEEAAQIVQSHLTKGRSPTYGPVTTRLVEYGIARLRDEHGAQIIEPLAFLSLMRWLQTKNHVNLEANLQSRLGFPDSRGPAYEELIILYLLQKLRYPAPFNAIFTFHGTPPVWADEMAHIIGRVDGTDVDVDVMGPAPQNPGVGVVQYAESIEDVLKWIEARATASAVLIPSRLTS